MMFWTYPKMFLMDEDMRTICFSNAKPARITFYGKRLPISELIPPRSPADLFFRHDLDLIS